MAFNLAALKGLFGKLKPAAKTIANYGDDVAGAVANYGDDVARLAASPMPTGDALENMYKYQRKYGDPVIAPDDVIGDMYLASSGKSYMARKDPVAGIQMFSPSAIDNTDRAARHGYVLDYADGYHSPAAHTWKLRRDGDYEFPMPIADDSYLQLDPDIYKSELDGTPDFDSVDVRPERFEGLGSYSVPFELSGEDKEAYEKALQQGFISYDILPRKWDAVDLDEVNRTLDALGNSPSALPKSYSRYSIMPSINPNSPAEQLYQKLSGFDARFGTHPLAKPYYERTLNRAYDLSGRKAQDAYIDFFESGAYLEPDSYFDMDDYYAREAQLEDEIYADHIKSVLKRAMFGK